MIGIAHSSPSCSGVTRLVGRDEAAQAFASRRGRRRGRSPRARCRRRAAARARARAPGAAARGCSPWAGAAGPCGSAPRSGRSCRAAIRPLARCAAVTSRPAVSRSQVWTRTRSFSSRRSSSRVCGRDLLSACVAARDLPCRSICSTLNSSARSGVWSSRSPERESAPRMLSRNAAEARRKAPVRYPRFTGAYYSNVRVRRAPVVLFDSQRVSCVLPCGRPC